MESITTSFIIQSIAQEENDVILISYGAIFKLDANNQPEKVSDFSKYGSRNYTVTPSITYCLLGRDLHSSEIGKFEFKKVISDFGYKIIADGASVAGIDLKLNINLIDKGIVNQNSFNYSIKNNNNQTAVLKDNCIYVVDQWGASAAYSADKIKKPRNAVFKLNLVTNDKQDITYDLPCLNKTGDPYGAVGDIVWHNNSFVVSTEEGIFRLVNNSWKELLDNWGLSKLFVLSNGELLAITSDSNYHVFNLFRNNEWVEVGKIQQDKTISIKNAILKDSIIYIHKSDYSLVAVDISSIQSPTYNKPKVAKYLNIPNIKVACQSEDKIYIAGDDIYQVINGSAVKLSSFVPSLGNPIIAIAPFKHDILVATSEELRLVKLGASIKIKLNKVTLRTEENTIFCLSDRHLIVLDETLSVIASGALYRNKDKDNGKISSHDYINDFTVINGIIYAVGFNNGRYGRIPVQIAFLNKYKIENAEIVKIEEKVWGFNASELVDNLADTRAYNIELLDDNHVVVVCEQAGGNGVLRFNGQNLIDKTAYISDIYDDPGTGKTKSAHILWYGVIDIHTNQVVSSRFAVPRNTQKSSNSNRARTLYTSNGNIFIGSSSSYKVPHRNGFFADKKIPTYRGSDASFLEAPSTDLKSRNWFTPGKGEILLYTDKYAIVATDSIGDLPSENNASGDSTNTYFIEW